MTYLCNFIRDVVGFIRNLMTPQMLLVDEREKEREKKRTSESFAEVSVRVSN